MFLIDQYAQCLRCWYSLLAVTIVILIFCDPCVRLVDGNVGDNLWVKSENISKWYTPLDLCILNNSSRVDIDIIIEDCKRQTSNSGSYAQLARCTVGNAWRGPQKSPFCSSEDIAYTERSHFRNAISGYDDPSQAPLKELFTNLSKKKGALLLIGDSVQQQFMGALACELEREGVWADPKQFWNTDEVKYVTPTSEDGTTQLPAVPIKFAAIYHFVNGRYDRIANASMHALKHAVNKFVDEYSSVVIVVNMGLHYVPTPVAHFSRSDYNSQMHMALSYLNTVAHEQEKLGKDIRIFWRETTAQHFDTPNGFWPGQRYASQMKMGCFPIKDPSAMADWRNSDIRNMIRESSFSKVQVIPFYELTVPLWSLHVNGHLRDCTHICWSPLLYQSFFHVLKNSVMN